jgi:hypothetical protein
MKNNSATGDIIEFILLILAFVLLFLTKYGNLNPLILLVLFVIPTSIYTFISSCKSFISKDYRARISTLFPFRLTGYDAQTASILKGLTSLFILIICVEYGLAKETLLHQAILFYRSRYFYTITGVVILIELYYVYLVIFKNKLK